MCIEGEMSDDSNDSNDTRPFPVQGGWQSIARCLRPPCTIPWWLAEIAYKRYAELYGKYQSLERLAQRGGFGREELVELLKGERP